MQAMTNFLSLPLEIRQEIYFLATPARVVHLKTDCNGSCCRLPIRISEWILGRCPLKQRFYSKAPVPALLHCSFESRSYLVKKGYQLAFKTKTQEPMTWFNYDRDVLLKYQTSCSNVQFDADEAARVRRLAVDCPTDCLYDPIGYDELPTLHRCGDYCLYPFIKDFPALEEVFVVDWKRNTFPTELTRNTGYPFEIPSMRHRYDTENLWKCVKVEDSSLLRTMYLHDLREEEYNGPSILGGLGHGPAPKIADWGTFGHRSAYVQLELAVCREGQEHSVGDWRVPRMITPVHLIDERQEEILQQKQKIAVDELQQLREEWAPALKERKERIDSGGGVISQRELQYLWANRWEITCWIEKDTFS
ncbi:hypothetical protein FCIRC_10636 [Fusarium circinatum]|uniref:2EXR domain-containing protein n=1 Tax=Fusarium circinatum TaxID=48490 RepID=A0A8H5T9Q3_FUSCI|nr:hypothetical protein FCIRC_10636 [Fusarium circinatum]